MSNRASKADGAPLQVTVLDTSIASTNLGDLIIMEAVEREVRNLFPSAFVMRVATHEYLGRKSRSILRASDEAIVGGTNLLSSRMWLRPLWRLRLRDGLAGFAVHLLGAGWYQYQRDPDACSAWLLRRVLRRDGLHAVRDAYTAERLARAGIANVVVTGCPTLWHLDPERCASIPTKRATQVVTTVNTYLPDRERDARLLDILHRRYERVSLWPQTPSDAEYARSLAPRLSLLDPSLAAFDRLLGDEPDLDYVGVRLHAGIRALQHGRRTLIVEIDNRAREMGRDFGLPTVPRDDLEELEALVGESEPIALRLPVEDIQRWRDQYRSGTSTAEAYS